MRSLVSLFTLVLCLFSYGISQSAASEPKIINSKQVTLTGKAEAYREVAMFWIRLHTGQGKPVHLGALGNFSDSTRNCLESAAESQQPVTVQGTLVTYEGGDSGMDENTVQCVPTAKSVSAKALKLTDLLHNKYSQESEPYALADTLLNATWKQVKPNVNEEQYKQILQQQRQWASKGRDEAASRYAASMPEAEAFTTAMQERTAELVSIVAADPMRGTYEGKLAGFTAVMQDGAIVIEGDAASEQGNVCSFDGRGKAAKGWITMQHADAPDFYLLFTAKGAQIAYITSGESQGCGMGVGFNYSYARK